MQVKDLMSSSITYVTWNTPIDEISILMRSENIGIVPVCDVQNHLLGVITDRDIIVRKERGHTAEEIMTEEVITVDAKDDIHQAALKFSKYGVHRLPVMENNRLVGMLSLKDMAKKKVFTAEIGHIIYNIYNHK